MFAHSVHVRKLLCEVVRLKVESEEVVNRIRVSNGEELIMARKYSNLPIFLSFVHWIVAILGGKSETFMAKGMDAERVGF